MDETTRKFQLLMKPPFQGQNRILRTGLVIHDAAWKGGVFVYLVVTLPLVLGAFLNPLIHFLIDKHDKLD